MPHALNDPTLDTAPRLKHTHGDGLSGNRETCPLCKAMREGKVKPFRVWSFVQIENSPRGQGESDNGDG